jgi:hypothetical protein
MLHWLTYLLEFIYCGRETLSGYFLFSRFDWSIFVTQLVAKHMKEIIKLICNGIKKIKCSLMKCHTNVYTPPTQLAHTFSYIVAILIHNHFESPNRIYAVIQDHIK